MLPRCYVGKQKLEKGIAAYKAQHPSAGDTFTVEWFPFYLNPEAPKQGIDKQELYHTKFGPEKTRMIHERLALVGKDVGIDFKFGGRTGNTRVIPSTPDDLHCSDHAQDSHRLLQLAKTKSVDTQTQVVDALFKSYFEDEEVCRDCYR